MHAQSMFHSFAELWFNHPRPNQVVLTCFWNCCLRCITMFEQACWGEVPLHRSEPYYKKQQHDVIIILLFLAGYTSHRTIPCRSWFASNGRYHRIRTGLHQIRWNTRRPRLGQLCWGTHQQELRSHSNAISIHPYTPTSNSVGPADWYVSYLSSRTSNYCKVIVLCTTELTEDLSLNTK